MSAVSLLSNINSRLLETGEVVDWKQFDQVTGGKQPRSGGLNSRALARAKQLAHERYGEPITRTLVKQWVWVDDSGLIRLAWSFL
jgi:hypothetical protein